MVAAKMASVLISQRKISRRRRIQSFSSCGDVLIDRPFLCVVVPVQGQRHLLLSMSIAEAAFAHKFALA